MFSRILIFILFANCATVCCDGFTIWSPLFYFHVIILTARNWKKVSITDCSALHPTEKLASSSTKSGDWAITRSMDLLDILRWVISEVYRLGYNWIITILRWREDPTDSGLAPVAFSSFPGVKTIIWPGLAINHHEALFGSQVSVYFCWAANKKTKILLTDVPKQKMLDTAFCDAADPIKKKKSTF